MEFLSKTRKKAAQRYLMNFGAEDWMLPEGPFVDGTVKKLLERSKVLHAGPIFFCVSQSVLILTHSKTLPQTPGLLGFKVLV